MLVLEQNFETVSEQHAVTYWLFAPFFYLILYHAQVSSWLPFFTRNDSKDVFDSLH